MKQYEYVTLEIGQIMGLDKRKYRSVIEKYAKDGFVYKGFMPLKMDGGCIREIDLIFEIDSASE